MAYGYTFDGQWVEKNGSPYINVGSVDGGRISEPFQVPPGVVSVVGPNDLSAPAAGANFVVYDHAGGTVGVSSTAEAVYFRQCDVRRGRYLYKRC